jgi:hypothetical protein
MRRKRWRMRSDDVLEVVATCDPLSPSVLQGPIRDARDARARSLLRDILAESERSAEDRSSVLQRPVASRRAVLVAGASVTALAAAAVLTVSSSEGVGEGSDIETPPLLQYQLAAAGELPKLQALPPAAPVLLAAAAAADRQLKGPAPSGKTAYTKTRDWYMNVSVEDRQGTAAIAEELNQRLWAPDGTRRYIRQISESAGKDDSRMPGPLPRWLDPTLTAQQLEQQLLAGAHVHDESVSYRLLGAITDLHLNEVVSPRSAAVMWRTLAAHSDIRSLGQTRDRAGRAGQAITTDCSYAGAYSKRRVLIIDPASGRLLTSEEIYLTKPKRLRIQTPAVNEYHVYLDQRWVANINDLP